MHEIPVLRDLVILVAIAIPVVIIAQRLRVPTVVGFLLTGIAIGPNALADTNGAPADASPAAVPAADAEAGRRDRPPGGVILARRLIAIQGGTANDNAGAYVIRLAGPRDP